MKPSCDQEENELVILHLRQLCETKQKTHVHIGEGPQVRHKIHSTHIIHAEGQAVRHVSKRISQIVNVEFVWIRIQHPVPF